MGGSVSERQGDEKFHLLSEAEGLWPPRGSVACLKGRVIARDSAYEREARMLNWLFYKDVFKG